ncbi:MAG: hypothetical protein GX073_00215 [Firmicutes bacterium]|nr:hypothetical protein [Bacillota bacterium]
MALIKYTISVVKENPLLKIKVTGIYNEKGQDIYYQNPITGGWARIPGGEENGNLVATQGLSVEFVKKLVSCLKNLADRFYEESKDFFGGPVCRDRREPEPSRCSACG